MPYFFQDVLESLNGITVLRSSVKFPKAFYFGTRFLFDDEPDRGNGYIYVGMSSAFRPGDTGQGKAFLLREDVPGTMEEILAQECNVAFVAEDTDMLKLFSTVNDQFVQTARVSDSAAYLVSSLTKYSGMPALLDTCAEILHNPVLLGTVQQTHFICSERYTFEDENALASLETYYISREMCSEQERAWVRDKLLSNTGPFIVTPGNPNSQRRIIAGIFSGNESLGSLFVLEVNKPFDDEDLALTQLMCNIIAGQLKNNQDNNTRHGIPTSSSYNYYLRSILSGKPYSEAIISSWLRTIGWHKRSNFRAFWIPLRRRNYTVGSPDVLRNYIEREIPCCRTAFYDEAVVVLSNPRDDQQFLEIRSALIQHLEETGMSCGASPLFRSIYQFRENAYRAKDAIAVGSFIRPDQTFYDYDNYRFHILLSKVGENGHLADYCHEALDQLRDYDAKNNGDYYETLRTFLMCDRNKDATAAALHIHRNTLKYRLKKITEITHVDMNDTEEMVYIFLSYKMKELSDRLQSGGFPDSPPSQS